MSKKSLIALSIIALLAFSWRASGDPLSVTAEYKGSPVVMTSNPSWAHIISSITWDGVEFVKDDLDAGGVQLQATISFEGHGGCWQAVEGGSRDDPGESTSIVESASAYGSTIKTRIQPAYWLRAGTAPTFPRCGQMSRSQWDHTVAVNTTNMWDGRLDKTASMNYRGMGNVIETFTRYELPTAYSSVLFVPLSLYSPGGFAPRHVYNLDENELEAIDYGGAGYPTYNEENYDPVTDQFLDNPVILSAADGEHAIGVYSPDAVDRWAGPWWGTWPYGVRSLGYGRWYMNESWGAKIALFYSGGQTASPIYNFRQFVVLGSLQDVADTIGYLHATERPTVTRAYAARVINLAFGTDYNLPPTPSFLDVVAADPYYPDIEQFKADGITTGCGSSMYCPDQLLTRSAMVTFLLRKIGESANPNLPQVFDDVSASTPLFGWIQRAYEIGLTDECAPDHFCPNDPVTIETLQEYIERIR